MPGVGSISEGAPNAGATGASGLVEKGELEQRASGKPKKPTPQNNTPTQAESKASEKPKPNEASPLAQKKPTPSPHRKPTPSPTLKKPATTPNAKKCNRANNNSCGKTADYLIVEKAAAVKKQTLQLNQAYWVVFKNARTPICHHRLVVATVRKNADDELDIVAFGSELNKDRSDPNKFKQMCKKYHGAVCSHNPIDTTAVHLPSAVTREVGSYLQAKRLLSLRTRKHSGRLVSALHVRV
jgi:hypothetical protein